MRTIAIINQKGGCGKTTTTINLGACLAHSGKRVLIADLDPQAHATLGLGINPGECEKSVYDLLVSRETAARDIIRHISDRFHLLPSDIMLGAAEPVLLQRENRERQLFHVLEPMARDYDFILIDCPPNIGILTFNALFACTEVIIPMESGLFALHGLAKLLETIDLVNRKRAADIAVHALATMYDSRTRIARESLEELKKHMHGNVFRTCINLNVKLKEAAGYGRTILDYDRGCPVARDYLSLAGEVLSIRKPGKKGTDAGLIKPVVTREGVLFNYYSPNAEKVFVVADFNDWKVNRSPMKNVDGVWQKLVRLKKGKYEYKFYVDGEWVNDPNNPNRVRNEFGENSIVEIE